MDDVCGVLAPVATVAARRGHRARAVDVCGARVAQVEVDTDALALAAARTAGVAGALLGVAGPRGDASAAAGDATLAAAVAELHATWAPAHRSLTSDLDALAAALRTAATLLDGAESATAGALAGVLVPSATASPLRARAV